MAAYVALLARHLGWSEDYILWELPLIRGNAYCHAIMRLNNVNTKWATDVYELGKKL